ncbi:MAG: glycoside hydrolase family 88 protein [Cyclobacteriaceae bacterium]|nr:glycoside hydrolase family 88 protein [Cyclobacteriaceae bacterium]
MKNFLLLACLLVSFNPLSAQQQARHTIQKSNAPTSETYQSFTFNGAWCWFSDPRAVYYEGTYKRTYAGWVDNYGDIHIGYFDHETLNIHSKVIADKLEVNDHVNPSLIFDEKGHLIVFFNKHMQGDHPMYTIRALAPESIEEWSETQSLYLNDESLSHMGIMNHVYTNPIKLSAENGRMFNFWRGADGKPSFSYSDDNGISWETGRIFFMPEPIYKFRRPYVKVYSDGIDKIHITLTDGHPHREENNSIYYMYYQSGSFYKANGTKIKSIDDLPVMPTEADLVYDAARGKAKAWNWDIAQDAKGNPVIAYARFPTDENHIYCYAKWDGKKWLNYDLVNSGGWFPQTPEGKAEPEPNYSGGMNIDKENPDVLYLSVKRDSIFEIEKWATRNNGKNWSVDPITKGSAKDNVRPFAVRGAKAGNPVQVLWMQNTKYIHFADAQRLAELAEPFNDRFVTSIKMDVISPSIDDGLNQKDIVNIMHRVADWQFVNPIWRHHRLDWQYGAFYTGIRALYETTGANRYKNEMFNLGEAYNWQPMDEIFHADRLLIIDNWSWLYHMENKPEMIDKSRWALDIHLARRYERATDVRFAGNPNSMEWWSWCDALYMAPPSFVEMWKITGDEKYLKYMDRQWWVTSDYLYSSADSLYFRDDRFFDRRSDNGTKIYWSRGNGWVIAGLARILQNLPADHEMRGKFVQQYHEMAHKILSLQGKDGMWRVSLIDPEYLNIGESSGSSFFTYALAWGINNGLLDAKYRPNVEKAWQALCNNVNAEGRLGYVQQIAGDPYPFYEDQWHVYASGAFLMAGSEVLKMIE